VTVSASFLVKDPPLDRLVSLVEYLRPVVGEFVFAIDDRTGAETIAAIARWEGAVVVPFHWVDDFSAGRNASLARCTSDWTLVLDPDELIQFEIRALGLVGLGLGVEASLDVVVAFGRELLHASCAHMVVRKGQAVGGNKRPGASIIKPY